MEEAFDYLPLKTKRVTAGGSSTEDVYQPKTAATLRVESGASTRLIVLFDTGASWCVFPMVAALELGLDLLGNKERSFGGVGAARYTSYEAEVEIELGESVRVRTTVLFSEAMDHHGFGILGHDGFFDRFDVEFRASDRKVVVRSIG